MFQINETTGFISNKKIVDFEDLGDEVVLEIKAEDAGKARHLHSIARVSPIIHNVIDEIIMYDCYKNKILG